METLCFLVAVFAIFQLSTGENEYCYVKDKHPYLYFGSKTSYDLVRGQGIPTLPGCIPTYIWALVRHGNRFMGQTDWTIHDMKDLRDEIVKNHESYKRGHLCQEDLELLKKWTFRWSEEMNSDLTEQGKADMTFLAKRLKDSFKNLMENPTGKFNFLTSSKSRCRNSSLAFTNELFGTSYTNLDGHEIKRNDALLRILQHLPSLYHKEVERFERSKYIRQLTESISKRLGFKLTLNLKTILAMESHCAFETSWDLNARAPWCVVFTPDDLKVLEFFKDLKSYYYIGHGRPEALRAACIVLKDMVDKLMNAVSSDTSEAGVFYFTHSETVVPLLSKLGLYSQDKPLSLDNYEKQLSNRKWRISLFDPFAANFIAVTYQCKNEKTVVFYLNEKKVDYPNCENGVCSLEVLENLMGELTPEKCDISPHIISKNDDDEFNVDDFEFDVDTKTNEKEQTDEATHKKPSPTDDNTAASDTNNDRKVSKKIDEKETNNEIVNKENTSNSSDGIFCGRIYSLKGYLISFLIVTFLHTS